MTTQIAPIAGANPRAFEAIEIPDSLRVLVSGETRRPGQGMFRILSQIDGDKRVVWNAGSLLEIRDAKQTFDELIEQGLVAYRVNFDGQRSTEVMTEFEATAEEIIFVPVAQLVGG